MRKLSVSLLIIFLSNSVYSQNSNNSYWYTLLYPWKQLEFTFQTEEAKSKYIPSNALPCGVNVNSRGEYFVTVPRFKPSVPSSLNKIKVKDGIPFMQPFPSWELNAEGNVTKNLQSILGLEIDRNDVLWALDQGHVAAAPAIAGSLKVVAINTLTGEVIESYGIERDIASLSTSYLNDLAVDIDKQFIYISDTGTGEGFTSNTSSPGLIILNLRTKKFRRVLENTTYVSPDPTLWVNVNGERIQSKTPISAGINGITLSCDGNLLYFSSTTSREIYSIETKYLRNFGIPEVDIAPEVVKIGYTTTAMEGILATKNNNLLITGLERDGILLKKDISNNPLLFNYMDLQLICYHHQHMIWPDTIGFNNKEKKLVFIANQAQNFFAGNIDFDTPKYGYYNFRLYTIYMDDQSYVMGCTSNSNYFPGWAIAVIFVASLFGFMILVCIYNCISRPMHKKNAHNLLPTHKDQKI